MSRKTWLNIVFVLLAVGTGVALSTKPWKMYAQYRERANEAQAEMRNAEKSRADLMRLKARYDSPIGREELARKQGYTKQGEKSIEGN